MDAEDRPPPRPGPPRPDRHRAPLDRARWDVVVIGAGVGGLVAGALLARRGRSVLVVDAHAVPGGNATVFRRRGYRFDVGVHYTAGGGPEGDLTRILAAAGAAPVPLRELDPDGFDTLVLPGLTFRVPRGLEAYRERLVAHFPGEAAGIDRFLGVLAAVWSLRKLPGLPLRRLPGALLRAGRALPHLEAPLGALLDGCVRDPLLRAVLAGQHVDYAEPPSRAALAAHAVVVLGLLEGAWYPRGGGQAVSDALAAAIEAHGGRVLLLTRARRIGVRGGRAARVELESHHLGPFAVEAGAVVSNADLKRTLLELVEPRHLSRATRVRTRRAEMAPALGVAYLGARLDLSGRPATNYIVHPDLDLEAPYAAARAGRFHPAPFCYVSSPTLKDPDDPGHAPPGVANLELMTVVPARPAAWGTSAPAVASGEYRRAPAYRAAKRAFAASLVAQAERVLPGLAAAIVHEEVASPHTHTRYTGSTGGTGYGLALVPRTTLLGRPAHRTELPGLYLCGASTVTGHGLLGAAWSGALVAAQLGGWALMGEVTGRRRPAPSPLRTRAP